MLNFLKNIVLIWETDALTELASVKNDLRELREIAANQEELLASHTSAKEVSSNQESTGAQKWVIGALIVVGVGITFWYFGGSGDAILIKDLTNSLGTQSTDLTKTVLDRVKELETAQIAENTDRNKVLLDALESIQNRLLKSVSDLSNQLARSQDVKFNVDDIFKSRK